MNGFPLFALLFSLYVQSPALITANEGSAAIPEPSTSPPPSSPVPPPPGWGHSAKRQQQRSFSSKPGPTRSGPESYRSRPRWGGFGGMVIRPTAIGRDFGLLLGASGGVTYDRYFFGGSGYTLMASTARPYWDSSLDMGVDPGVDPGGPRPQSPPTSQLDLEYAGVFFGMSALRFGIVDLSAKLFVGFGRACVDLDEIYNCYISTPIFVSEPEFLVYFNVAPAFRLGLSAGYRFVVTSDWSGPGHFDLAGPHGSLLVEFGWF